MNVPEHISATGESVFVADAYGLRGLDTERVVERMNVPDRIILTGGEGYHGYASQPRIPDEVHGDIKIESQDVPSRITVDKLYPDEPTIVEDTRSSSSIAIDENPLQELKLMRRQLVRISNRVYDLENQVESSKVRETRYLLSSIVGVAAAIILFFIRR
ncbi:unnamed protein product [Auanema sp. JU1783]|nr:unnamed protein product [Auanema sp. JU1783]